MGELGYANQGRQDEAQLLVQHVLYALDGSVRDKRATHALQIEMEDAAPMQHRHAGAHAACEMKANRDSRAAVV